MKVVSLFSGIGGFEKGILQAEPNTKIVFASEIDPYARKIYTKNYGVEPHGDITKIKASNIPNHNILCGGFPCQSFSIAGKRRGFEDTRGTLFFEIMRIVKIKRPKLLFLENVPGLLSHDEGRTFHTILRSLDEMGYDAEWQVFNSRNHGVPQNRERVFIIGHLRGAGTQPIFPITKDDNIFNGECNEERANCLTSRYGKDGKENLIKCHTLQPRSSKLPGGSGPLSRKDGNTYCLDTGNCMAVEVPNMAGCLTGGGHSGGLHSDMTALDTGSGIRRLTPIECERLQGYPDNWTAGVSDTQRYKQLGNAVTVNVIEFIARRLFKMMEQI